MKKKAFKEILYSPVKTQQNTKRSKPTNKIINQINKKNKYNLSTSIGINRVNTNQVLLMKWIYYLIISKCHHLYVSRCFGSFLGWISQVYVNTMLQSSQGCGSQQIHPKVRACNAQRKSRNSESYISDSAVLSQHVKCKNS